MNVNKKHKIIFNKWEDGFIINTEFYSDMIIFHPVPFKLGINNLNKKVFGTFGKYKKTKFKDARGVPIVIQLFFPVIEQ